MSPRPHRSASVELQQLSDEQNSSASELSDVKPGGEIGAVFRNGKNDSTPIAPDKNAVSSIVNAGEQDEMEIHGYRPSLLLQIVTWIFILMTLGLLRIVFHWFEEWYLKCTHVPCSLDRADKILVVEIFQKKYRRIYVRNIKILSGRDIQDPDQSELSAKANVNDHAMESIRRSDRKLVLPLSDGTFLETDTIRMFTCKKMRYLWDPRHSQFLRLKGWGHGLPTSSLHASDAQQGQAGLSAYEEARRRVAFDSNYIHVPVKSPLQLLFLEVINPFYVFQVFSVIIWFLITYYSFATAIIIMSAAGIVSTIYQTRKNQKKLRSTVHSSDLITVCRGDGNFETVRTEDLVPGDIIVIPANGCVMHCDAVLLFGTCIVNESMLTGESVPVTKTPLPQRSDVLYSTKEHARHTLFCGTKVVQTRYFKEEKVMAVVTCTGFMTSKGSLVSAIMYPPPVDFQFERDSYRFIGFLALLASVGFAYNVAARLAHGEEGKEIFLHSFDLITICIPPALPAAMTAGIILAQERLKKRRIYCISPRSINVSGSLNCVCFDKTGTLTEDGLDLWGVVPVADKNRFLPPLKTPSKLPQALAATQPHHNGSASTTAHQSPPPAESSTGAYEPPMLLMGMATCHSLTIIDNVLSGDPLDLKMFEATGWTLTEPSDEDNSKYDNICPTIVTGTHDGAKVDVGIIRQFPFSSALQRMAVLCRVVGESQLRFICKGSPEMIQSLSDPQSVPADFAEVLEEYTKQGYRVIALAHRTVELRSVHKLQKVQREDLEHDLTFLGLVILENRLKSDTTAIIGRLSEATVRTIMVTGDNLLTAISVARDCGMVGANDQVVVVSAVESTDDISSAKPVLQYTLAEKSLRFSSEARGHGTAQDSSEVSLDMPDDLVTSVNGVGNAHLAVTGKSWAVIREHYPELVSSVAVKGTVFARMSPDQKQQLVQELQHLGYYVGMCGDGANDCGALKAAHAGIALSDSEASVASPFTSKDSSIACVPELIREGRCALVTSFGIFKYMAAYSLTQFISAMILYDIGSNLTDSEYLYVDFFLACGLCFFFGYNDPFPGPLHNKPPLTSLISPSPVGSLVIQTLFVGLFQGFSLMMLSAQPWFVPFNTTNSSGFLTGDISCHENYTVFSMSMFQYIILALAFAKGIPYRTAFYKNYVFTAILLFLTACSVWVLLEPLEFFREWLELKVPEHWDFKLMLLGLCGLQMVTSLLLEKLCVDMFLERLPTSAIWRRFRPPKEKHLAIRKQLEADSWPQISPSPAETLSPGPANKVGVVASGHAP